MTGGRLVFWAASAWVMFAASAAGIGALWTGSWRLLAWTRALHWRYRGTPTRIIGIGLSSATAVATQWSVVARLLDLPSLSADQLVLLGEVLAASLWVLFLLLQYQGRPDGTPRDQGDARP